MLRTAWIMKFAWKRLIRFVGADLRIQYGEPDIEQVEDLMRVYEERKLKARPLIGGIFDDRVTISSELVEVMKLLGPLEPSQVPMVKGIGLNYVSHSMCSKRP